MYKYLSSFTTASSSYHVRMAKQSVDHFLRRPLFIRSRCALQLRSAHSDAPKPPESNIPKDAPKPPESNIPKDALKLGLNISKDVLRMINKPLKWQEGKVLYLLLIIVWRRTILGPLML